MIAFEVKLNGKRVCIAGADDLTVLSAHIVASGKLGSMTARTHDAEGDIGYALAGFTGRADPAKDLHVRWKSNAPLQIGDTIQVKVVEVEKADRPTFKRNVARRRAQGKNR